MRQLREAATHIALTVPRVTEIRIAPGYSSLIVVLRRVPGDDPVLARLRRLVRTSMDIPVSVQQVAGPG